MAERSMRQDFGGIIFAHVCCIDPHRDACGAIAEYAPVPSTHPNLHHHGQGPFCRFRIPAQPKGATGVYVLAADDLPLYVGICEDLTLRFNTQYGTIYRRNCLRGGRQTNCRINHLILETAKAGKTVDLWFSPSDDRFAVEVQLFDALSPKWNARRPDGRERKPRLPSSPTGRTIPPAFPADPTGDPAPRREDFERELRRRFEEATARAVRDLEVNAGDLHRAVGGYPASNHRMTVCCATMQKHKRDDDEILARPPRGLGATLTIRYRIPR